MIRRTSQPLTAWFLVWDLALTAVAWLASYWLRFDLGLIPVRPRVQPDFALYLAQPAADRDPRGRRVPRRGDVRGPPAAPVPRGTRRGREGRRPDGAGGDGDELRAGSTTTSRGWRWLMFVGRHAVRASLAARRATWMAVRRLRARGVNQSHALIVGTGRLARRTVRTLRVVNWSGIQTVGLRRGRSAPRTRRDRPARPRLASPSCRNWSSSTTSSTSSSRCR